MFVLIHQYIFAYSEIKEKGIKNVANLEIVYCGDQNKVSSCVNGCNQKGNLNGKSMTHRG
jgi:hypothetical protein